MHENILAILYIQMQKEIGSQSIYRTPMFSERRLLNAQWASGDSSGIRLLPTIYSFLCRKYMCRLPRDSGGMGLSLVGEFGGSERCAFCLH